MKLRPWMLLAAAAAMATPAEAQQTATARQPMTIGVVRLASPECGRDCPEVLALQGVVRTDSHRELQAALDRLKDRRLAVAVNSPGGDVDAALAMGRAIRAAGLDVLVARVAPDGAVALDGAICSSACTLILAGGVNRFAAPEARIGVHSMRQSETERVVERVYRRNGEGREVVSERVISQKTKPLDSPPEVANRGVAEHLAAMGIGKAFTDLTLSTPHSQIRVLSAKEKLETGIVTHSSEPSKALGSQLR